MTDLLQKNKPNQIVWTDNEVTSFKALKNAMIHAPVLRNPDFHRPFILQTDSSDIAIGAVLSQNLKMGNTRSHFLAANYFQETEIIQLLKRSVLQSFGVLNP